MQPIDNHRNPRTAQGTAGILLVLATSIVGAGISLKLTHLKFLTDYRPELAPPAGCMFESSTMSCDTALTSPAGTLLSLPLSLYATAFYVLVGLIAVSLLFRQRAFFGVAGIGLVLMACFSVFMSVTMATYSLVMLDNFCFLCTCLYGVSCFLLLFSLMVKKPWTADGVEQLRALWRTPSRCINGTFFVLYVFLAVFAVSSLVYQVQANKVQKIPILPPVRPPPPAKIHLGQIENPDITLHAFLDPACPRCQKKLEALERIARHGTGRYTVRVDYHLVPRDPTGGCLPPGHLGAKDSIHHRACQASIAILCIGDKKPEAAYKALKEFFMLQVDTSLEGKPWFLSKHIDIVARKLGFFSDELVGQNPIRKCIEQKENPWTREIRSTAQYVIEANQTTGMGALSLPYFIGVPNNPQKRSYNHPAAATRTELETMGIALWLDSVVDSTVIQAPRKALK